MFIFQVQPQIQKTSLEQAQLNWAKCILSEIEAYSRATSSKPTFNELKKLISDLDNSKFNTASSTLEREQLTASFEKIRSTFLDLAQSLASGGIRKSKDTDCKNIVNLLNDWSLKTNSSKDASSELSSIASALKKNSKPACELIVSALAHCASNPSTVLSKEELQSALDFLSNKFDFSDTNNLSVLAKLLSRSVYFNESLSSDPKFSFSVYEPADLSPMRNIGKFNIVNLQYSEFGNFSAAEADKGREYARFFISDPRYALRRQQQIFQDGLFSQVDGAKFSSGKAKAMKGFSFDEGFINDGLMINSGSKWVPMTSLSDSQINYYYGKNDGGDECLNDLLVNPNFMKDMWAMKDPQDPSKYLLRSIFSDNSSVLSDPNSKMPERNSGYIFSGAEFYNSEKYARFNALMSCLNAMANLELALDKFVYGFLSQIKTGKTNSAGGEGPLKFTSQEGVEHWRKYLFEIDKIFENPSALKNLLNDIVGKKLIKDQATLDKLEAASASPSPSLNDELKDVVRAEILKRILRFRLFFSSSVEIYETPQMKDENFVDKLKVALWQNARPLLYFYNYDKEISLAPPKEFEHLIDGVGFDIFNAVNATPNEAKGLSFSVNLKAYHMIYDYIARVKKETGQVLTLKEAFERKVDLAKYYGNSKYMDALDSKLPKLGKNGWDMSKSCYFVVYEDFGANAEGMFDARNIGFRAAELSSKQPFFMLKEPKYSGYYDGGQDWRPDANLWERNRKAQGSDKEYSEYPTFNIYNNKYRMFGMNSNGAQQIAIELFEQVPGNYAFGGTNITIPKYYEDGSHVFIPYDVKKRNSYINLDNGKTNETNWEYIISGTGKDADALLGIDTYGSFAIGNVFSSAPLMGHLGVSGDNRSGIMSIAVSKDSFPLTEEQFSPRNFSTQVVGKSSQLSYDSGGNPSSIDVFDLRLTVSWTDKHAVLSNGISKDSFTFLSAGHGSIQWPTSIANENINPLDKTEFYNAAWEIPVYRTEEVPYTLRREIRQEVTTNVAQPKYSDITPIGQTLHVFAKKELTEDGKLIINHCLGAISIGIEGGLIPKDMQGGIVKQGENSTQQNVTDQIKAANLPIEGTVLHSKQEGSKIEFYLTDANSDIWHLQLHEKLPHTGGTLASDFALSYSTLESQSYDLFDERSGIVVGTITLFYNKEMGEEKFSYRDYEYSLNTDAMREYDLANPTGKLYEKCIFNLRTDADGVLFDPSKGEVMPGKETPIISIYAKSYINADESDNKSSSPGIYKPRFKIVKNSPEFKALRSKVMGEENPDANRWVLINNSTGAKYSLNSKPSGVPKGTIQNYSLFDSEGKVILNPQYDLQNKQWLLPIQPIPGEETPIDLFLKKDYQKSNKSAKKGSETGSILGFVPIRLA